MMGKYEGNQRKGNKGHFSRCFSAVERAHTPDNNARMNRWSLLLCCLKHETHVMELFWFLENIPLRLRSVHTLQRLRGRHLCFDLHTTCLDAYPFIHSNYRDELLRCWCWSSHWKIALGKFPGHRNQLPEALHSCSLPQHPLWEVRQWLLMEA